MDETKDSPEKQDLKKDLEGEILTLQPSITCKKGSHFFIRKSGTEVTCTMCPVGYYVGPGMNVVKGHIYKGRDIVI
jgi:hypothetical protein